MQHWHGLAPANASLDSALTTHCVCVVGKNYRLQDIQLSKTALERNFRSSSSSPIAHTTEADNPGGEYRARTGDLLVANQALSQLS